MKVEEILQDRENESTVINNLVLMLTGLNKKPFNNKPGNYIALELSDDSGKIQAIKWEDAEEIYDSLSIGDIVRVNGTVSEYRGKKQIVVDNIYAEKGEYERIDFMPRVKNLDKIIEGFDKLLEMVMSDYSSEDEGYIEVLDSFLASSYYDLIKEWPAAISYHHDKMGGLLQHTFSVARHVYFASTRQPEINFFPATLGAIFHDIGKIEEYSFETGVTKMTRKGLLFGHKVLGMKIVEEFCRASSLSEEKKDILLHIIASHHGKKEYGAITEPKIPEAVLVHHADLMDAECYKVIDALETIDAGEFDYSGKYKGYVYKPQIDL